MFISAGRRRHVSASATWMAVLDVRPRWPARRRTRRPESCIVLFEAALRERVGERAGAALTKSVIVRVLPSPSTCTRWPSEKPASIHERPSSRVTVFGRRPPDGRHLEVDPERGVAAAVDDGEAAVRSGPEDHARLGGRDRRHLRAALEPQDAVVRALDPAEPPGALESLDHYELTLDEAVGLPGLAGRERAGDVPAEDPLLERDRIRRDDRRDRDRHGRLHRHVVAPSACGEPDVTRVTLRAALGALAIARAACRAAASSRSPRAPATRRSLCRSP